MIKMTGIQKIYAKGKMKVMALRGVDVEIDAGEFVSIVGPSGSGKSTLMNIAGCLDVPSEGVYELDGEPVEGLNMSRLAEIRNKKVGFVFQNFNLLPYATAFENVELPMIFGRIPTKTRRSRTTELLEKVGLSDRMDHKPTELSGGEMQRVAIARALSNQPKLILADEPTGNLDSTSGAAIIDLFEELWRTGTTILMITHDSTVASRTNRVVFLKDGLVVTNASDMARDMKTFKARKRLDAM
ncbi:MAG: ABC transporter ATP-binding protein [candidate division Zixibacteria bacterium]|nr:ABC transporter ATP-binding protein [candidate division Zixibacteria bacterium]MBU1471038.1 ABC transporter ATP-binding protein [candidate division Zixibacteria bacterium]MBU2625073.1 ABC transporter ATP-binding protein [candidate division Zixibacteria bacterium]